MIDRWSSGGAWEDIVGYSRVVAAGPLVLTAGCTSAVEGEIRHEGDPYHQTLEAFGVALRALEVASCRREDVVQTRMYVVHARDRDEVGRAHAELFGAVRPVTSMLIVAGLFDPRMLVEVEVLAYREG